MAQVSLEGSRLVRFLNDLVVSDAVLFDKGFAERISQLIGLQQSLALSGLKGRLAGHRFEPLPIEADAIRQEFLRVNQALVESIVESFRPGSGSVRVQFPGTRLDSTQGQLSQFGLYSQFYTARQRELERKCLHLLSFVRDGVAGLSPRLAQLVMVETALADAINGYDRQCLAKIPKLLEGRFDELRQVTEPQASEVQTAECKASERESNTAEQADLAKTVNDDFELVQGPTPDWVQQFAVDMRGLLLAELELRLLPVLGLLEAITEEPGTEKYPTENPDTEDTSTVKTNRNSLNNKQQKI